MNLGPHPPRLWPEDVDRLHEIWLTLSQSTRFGSKLHHRDVVGLALRRLEKELDTASRDDILTDLHEETQSHQE